MKKVLFLGASQHQIPPILYAKSKGHHVITCDYLSDNPGHKLADESYNVSTTDLKKVYQLAKKLKVDGVVAYASDPASPTQAYVSEKLGLVGNPYESVLTLARKDLFRDFLTNHDFLVPKSQSFYSFEEAKEWLREISLPVIVKPVDSSGSKGVTKIVDELELKEAFDFALNFSREKKIVVEEFFVRDGYQVAGDGFVVDGQLAFRCWANEHFDKLCNPLVPIGESFPSVMPDYTQSQAHSETQRLLQLLEMKNGALNFDYHYNEQGDFSFLELGPRNGGNLIPEVIKHATGVDLIKYTVDSALGEDCSGLSMLEPDGFYSSYMIHSIQNGQFRGVSVSESIKHKIIQSQIYCQKGDKVSRFDGSNHTLGAMILKYDNEAEMLHMMDNMEEFIRVEVERV
ncbi:ATP-grasp domain-containing protein [Methylophaga thiooxydans]|uniref:ATP-grasp domain-containing protein n=1 Tax=Methylophaga thiooxydans TaxID=392484 RepID=UPI002354CBCF|nr:hypothetical protein [Methylophaga thiooxydans]